MGLDVNMVFVSSDKEKINSLSEYFKHWESLPRPRRINAADLYDSRSVNIYNCLRVSFRNTYCNEVLEEILSDDKISMLNNVAIFHQSTEDTDYSYVDFSNPESLKYRYVTDCWERNACNIAGLSGSIINNILEVTGMY